MKNGKVITLDNGLRVYCISKPHFYTSSVRILVSAGSLHENIPGSAHFFEHICFQGTKEFPTQKKLNAYADKNALYKNAYTNQTETVYSVDGPELEPVLRVATQLAFEPLLTAESLEKERPAIIDEARGIQFSPGVGARQKQWRALGGERFSKLVTGTIDDIVTVTHKDLLAFHEQQYRAENIFIIISSSESVDDQLHKLKEFIGGIKLKKSSKPKKLGLDWLEHGDLYSLEQNELDAQSQTMVSLYYELASPKSYRDYLLEVTATNVLRQKAHEHLREDLVMVYGASATATYLNNRNYGLDEDFQALTLYSQVQGDLAKDCIAELKKVPKLAIADTTLIQNKINNIRYSGALDRESNTISTADTVTKSPQIYYEEEYDPSRFVEVVQSFTVDDVREEIKKITTTLKLIQVTSPNAKVLKSIKQS